jgi:type IV secretory pathway component VirB8
MQNERSILLSRAKKILLNSLTEVGLAFMVERAAVLLVVPLKCYLRHLVHVDKAKNG